MTNFSVYKFCAKNGQNTHQKLAKHSKKPKRNVYLQTFVDTDLISLSSNFLF